VTENRHTAPLRLYPRLRRQTAAILSPGGLGRASLLVLSSSIATRAVGFVATIIGAAALGPRHFGEFAFAATTASFIAAAGVLGFAPLTTKRIANAKTEQDACDVGRLAVTTTLLLLSLLSIGYWMTCVRFAPWLQSDLGTYRAGVAMVSIWAVSVGVTQVLSAVLSGHKDFTALANLTLLRGGIVGVSTAAAAFITRSAVSTTAAAALSEMLACVITFSFTSLAGRLRGSTRAGWLQDGWSLMRGSLGSGAASLLIMGSIWGSMALLLTTPAGHEQNGGFSLANRLTLAITIVPSALAVSSLPFFSGDLGGEMRSRRLRRMIRMSSAWAIASAAALAVLSPLVLPLLGSNYSQFTGVVVIMCATGVAMSANAVLGCLAVSDGRIRRWIISDLALATTLMALSWATVGTWGAGGLAIAYLISYSLSAATLLPLSVFVRSR
jgi:O-antigen/teichoic acid export membrane protein